MKKIVIKCKRCGRDITIADDILHSGMCTRCFLVDKGII